MSKSEQVDTIRDVLAYSAIGFGALAMAAPRVFAGIYGLKGDGNLTTMIKLWGTRTAVVGALTLIARDDKAKRDMALAATALNAADTFFIATSGSDVSARTRVMGTLTTAGYAAAGGFVLSES